jgi:hypothetical protein
MTGNRGSGRSKKYPNQLTFLVTRQMQMELVAIAFFCGEKGFYSKPSKRFLQEGIDRFKNSLSVAKQKELKNILDNVVVQFDHGKLGPAKPYRSLVDLEREDTLA